MTNKGFWLCVAVVISSLTVLRSVGDMRRTEAHLRTRITLLEEYIENNRLPTPAIELEIP